jgi:alpha-L-rhamnosidase
MALYLHSGSLSPDPLYGRDGARAAGRFWSRADVYPHSLERVHPDQSAARRWGAELRLSRRPPALTLRPDSTGRAELVLDFGTELEGRLDLALDAPGRCNLYATFGESRPEAEAWGLPSSTWPATEHRHLGRRGRHRVRCDPRGFRLVRLLFHDLSAHLVLNHAFVPLRLAFPRRRGDFHCSDTRFQRVWQSSAYTARLCTREDTIWDGVKRDRHGWFGDARIALETTDNVFFDPAPAEQMLLRLPTDSWANGIPGYSFDAVAMLEHIILLHGTDRPALRPAYDRVRAMMAWARATHARRDGRLARHEGTAYFFDFPYLDWSPMPVGGRFEELSWLQLKYLEALHTAVRCAGWLGEHGDADGFRADARRLRRTVLRLFHRPGRGFVHTLNRAGDGWETIREHEHYHRTYVRKVRLGESGPSRHSCAMAVWADACDDAARREVCRVLNDRSVQPITTPYWAYYEQCARAECGDAPGAIANMRDYIGRHLEENDCPTVWESYEPGVRDFRRWGLHAWPKSLCHGWSSGAVPIATRYLLGIRPCSPGFATVRLDPALTVPWTYRATVPTPHGPIDVERPDRRGPVVYRLPEPVRVLQPLPEGVALA